MVGMCARTGISLEYGDTIRISPDESGRALVASDRSLLEEYKRIEHKNS